MLDGEDGVDWMAAKTALSDAIGLSRDALHILAGVGIQATFVLLLRSWFGALLPLLITLAAALGNELLDLTLEVWVAEIRHEQQQDSIKDVVLTMLVPLLLVLLCRFLPSRLTRPSE